MPGGGFEVQYPTTSSNGKVTAAVLVTCAVAASSGLIFGYDIGISGGVTTMPSFLGKFFPSILRNAAMTKPDMYCLYDSEVLTAFTSSLYVAGLVSSLFASRLIASLGRRNIILIGGCSFLAGGAFNGSAENVTMLIIGRLLLGVGVGFTNQATPVYLAEVAPPKWRGAFNTSFQFFINIGVLCANILNFAMSKRSSGWRISLGGAVVPAAIMTAGALMISDSPSSLVQRGKSEQARESLSKIRGSADVNAELDHLVKCNEEAKATNRESVRSLVERRNRQYIVMAIAIPFFQQFTGVSVVAFYAPVLFQTVGLGNESALLAAIILGVVNLLSVSVSTAVVDRFGRRFLFIMGGTLMCGCQVAVGLALAAASGFDGAKAIPRGYAVFVLVCMCMYTAGFSWSWGPLNWLVPSEIFPMKLRPIGQSISVAVNFATTFVLSQVFLAMLCHFKFGTFLFYAGWMVVMTVFIVLFLPETKGIPMESVHTIWEDHWYWKRFVAINR